MYELKIDGVLMPAPEADDYGVDKADFDGEASGRKGESGIMNRVVIRKGVEDIPFTFKCLTKSQKNALISAITPSSISVYINEDGEERTISGYVAKYKVRHAGWSSGGSFLWNVSFNLVQN